MSLSTIKYVNPVSDIGAPLLELEKPNRYCGGEYGRLASKNAPLQTLIAFPDLYEIGMSNQALRIIYNGLNRISGISCDRAFAPAPDFERLLREKGLPLYGLDTGISLKSLDLLLFTLGYELGFSGILAMLDVSGIPLRADKRGENDPLIIAGGPAVSNPLPYSAFIDAFWIGEAEAGFFDLAAELLEIQQSGRGRDAMFERIERHPNIWIKGKTRAVRAVDSSFAERKISPETPPAVFPIPSMKTVQHHGVLEIMRGCPNGCRFCHAGYWYRPMRQKSSETLVGEAEAFINMGGYREMSLSSLSSGDYSGIGELVDTLNERFSGRYVSFQLPSLRVSGFTLSLLEKISQTRKSGLTFAVETPLDFWQLAINKQVGGDSVVEILKEAKRHGWRGAKFYFMIGLPLPDLTDEVQSEEYAIVNFVSDIGRRTSMHFNVNVGIFVPKPHTPYQWAKQIDREAAMAKLDFIRSRLKPLGHKVSVSDPLVSMIEGVLSRGDERAGDLAEQVFLEGSRLDAWQEYISKEAWQKALEQNAPLVSDVTAEKNIDTPLPWNLIGSGVSQEFLRKEFAKSCRGELSALCAEDCVERCGICGGDTRVKRSVLRRVLRADSEPSQAEPEHLSKTDPSVWRLLFSFTKEGGAVFHGHLSLIEIFSMALNRCGLGVLYTQGFNPLAKLEIPSPLSTGISAGSEIAAVDFAVEQSAYDFQEKMNAALVEGIRVTGAKCYRIPSGSKKHSLSSLLWGFGYAGEDGSIQYIPASGEKAWREKCLEGGDTFFSLRRACVLAKNINITDDNSDDAQEQPWASYFDVYQRLYPLPVKT